MADLLEGYDSEGWEWFCDDVYNNLKNHWRQSVPCANLDGLTAGMIVSDEDDDKLYHVIDPSAGGCSEIAQDLVPFSDDKYLEFGDTDWGGIGFNNTNNALMLGVPVDPNRGLIICDNADISGDMTFITASAFPMVSIVDLDLDSYMSFGYAGDDFPDIWSNRVLNLQYEAIAGVDFFANSGNGENQPVRICGWNTAGGDVESTSLIMDDVNDEFLIQSANSANHEGITIDLLEANQRFRIRQNSDVLSWFLTATDANMRWSDGTLILMTDETDAPTVVRLMPNGTSEVSEIELYDTDGERLSLYTAADRAYIESIGGILGINPGANNDIYCFENCTEGENPYFYVWGFRTGDAPRYGRMRVEPTARQFEIEAENRGQLMAAGSICLQWNLAPNVTLPDDVPLRFGTGGDATIEYDENGDDSWAFGLPAGGLSLRSALADIDNAGLIRVEKVIKLHGSDLFDAAALTDSANIWLQPANTLLLSAKYVLDTQFAAVGMTDLDVTLGDAGDNTGILNPGARNLTSDAVRTNYTTRGAYWNASTAAGYHATAATQWIAYATAVGANLNTTSAGSITFYFVYIDFQGT